MSEEVVSTDMATPQGKARRKSPAYPSAGEVDPWDVFNSLPDPIFIVGPDDNFIFVNLSGEQFFSASLEYLRRHTLADILLSDSPLISLISQVRNKGSSLSENGATLSGPRFGERFVTIQISPISERPGLIVVTLIERSLAEKIGRQLNHRKAARSLTALSAMLAHEVKNPLSGIRGAAQLLEQTASPDDQELTQLICSETDRICSLVERMDAFAEVGTIEREPINVHQVLDYVRKLAESGFARHVRFVELYDPSLPLILGNRDLLIQVFLNLVKNAAESVPKEGGEIVLNTTFQHGVRLAIPGLGDRVDLPLMISVQDNGEGIPEDIHSCLFDPFVTTKTNGSGLGLALVAKIINDHGGVIEFDSEPRRTSFMIRLPIYHGDYEKNPAPHPDKKKVTS